MGETLKELLRMDQELEEKLIESGGELTEETEKAQLALEISLPQKIDSYYRVMKHLESSEEYFKARAEEFHVQAVQLKNARDRLKRNIKFIMEENRINQLSGNDYSFKLTNAKPKMIIQDELVPDEYKQEIKMIEIDKDKIYEDLSKEMVIPGCRFEPTVALRTSINKKKLI